jgi:hypothetical protein
LTILKLSRSRKSTAKRPARWRPARSPGVPSGFVKRPRGPPKADVEVSRHDSRGGVGGRGSSTEACGRPRTLPTPRATPPASPAARPVAEALAPRRPRHGPYRPPATRQARQRTWGPASVGCPVLAITSARASASMQPAGSAEERRCGTASSCAPRDEHRGPDGLGLGRPIIRYPPGRVGRARSLAPAPPPA